MDPCLPLCPPTTHTHCSGFFHRAPSHSTQHTHTHTHTHTKMMSLGHVSLHGFLNGNNRFLTCDRAYVLFRTLLMFGKELNVSSCVLGDLLIFFALCALSHFVPCAQRGKIDRRESQCDMCTLYTCHKVFIHHRVHPLQPAAEQPARPRVQCQIPQVNREPNFGFIYSLSLSFRASLLSLAAACVCGVD